MVRDTAYGHRAEAAAPHPRKALGDVGLRGTRIGKGPSVAG